MAKYIPGHGDKEADLFMFKKMAQYGNAERG